MLHGQKTAPVSDAHVEVRTAEGCVLRLLCVGFTESATIRSERPHAQHQQVQHIWKRMTETMTREVQANDVKEAVSTLIPERTGKDAEHVARLLRDVFVRKVKVQKKPEFELGKLLELRGEGSSSGKASGDETGSS